MWSERSVLKRALNEGPQKLNSIVYIEPTSIQPDLVSSLWGANHTDSAVVVPFCILFTSLQSLHLCVGVYIVILCLFVEWICNLVCLHDDFVSPCGHFVSFMLLSLCGRFAADPLPPTVRAVVHLRAWGTGDWRLLQHTTSFLDECLALLWCITAKALSQFPFSACISPRRSSYRGVIIAFLGCSNLLFPLILLWKD